MSSYRKEKMKLSAENVQTIFEKCLSVSRGELDLLPIEGIMGTYDFRKSKINEHAKDIANMLKELPDEFQKDGGGGMSFLNACQNNTGEQWTGLHRRMEELFVLGIAANKVKSVMPRDLWPVLPGGMPYYVVL